MWRTLPDGRQVWFRICRSFEEAEQADREYWASFTPEERVRVVDELRARHGKISGEPIPRLQRVVTVLRHINRSSGDAD